MSFICGSLLGIIISTIYWAVVFNYRDRKSVSEGVITLDGKIYGLKKIDITED